MQRYLGMFGILLLVGITTGILFVYSGWYNIAADEPHWQVTTRMIEAMRTRSIEHRAGDITQVPRLDDPQLVLKGAGQYAAMCEGCHLAPGLRDTEISRGLYPRPPHLYERRIDPRMAFVVIKHGIKMTGMPAWGNGAHGDAELWSLVAFINQLPGMSPLQYQDIVSRAPPDEDMEEHGNHGADEQHQTMPGMMQDGRMTRPQGAAGKGMP
jgi:hypothetical protein